MRLPTQLLQRKADTHKGNFGHIFILAGSLRYSGAAILCSQAAMRSGAGLVTLGLPREICPSIIKIKPPEVMLFGLPQTEEGSLSLSGYKKIIDFTGKADIIVVGPGLGRNKSTLALIRRLIKRIRKPLVLDADGLNALVGYLGILLERNNRISQPLILTPHPAEMARLMGVSTKKIQSAREGIARRFSRDYRITLVLKGHRSVVADYQGNLYVNRTGNPGMATAGSGDVLTGIIAAFLGQGLNPFDAARCAVYIHGLAGDLAAKEKTQLGMIASDIIEKIPEAIRISS